MKAGAIGAYIGGTDWGQRGLYTTDGHFWLAVYHFNPGIIWIKEKTMADAMEFFEGE
jgi:hypothetical protein